MGHILSHPLVSKAIQRRGNADFKVGSAEMQGFRVDMEDTMKIVLSDPTNQKNISYFGVYDGHGGDHASIFCEAKMHEFVLNQDDPMDAKSIVTSVMDADANFIATEIGDNKNHGSTCVFALVKSGLTTANGEKKYEISIANVGDSRAILIRKDGTVVELTVDHKPETDSEEQRIIAAGGSVSANRVDGQLAMSRAIGDFGYKNNADLGVVHQKVIPVPDVTTETAYEGDRLLICCDGIVEQMTGEEAANFTFDSFKTQSDPALVCAALLDHSLDAGSKDNHSAMIIEFTNGTAYESKMDNKDYLPGPFEPFMKSNDFHQAFMSDAAKHGYTPEDKTKWDALLDKAKVAEENMPQLVARGGQGADDDAAAAGAPALGQLLGQLSQQQKLVALMQILKGRPPSDDDDDDE